MTATVEITEALIRDHIDRAIRDVFKTMLGLEPRLSAKIASVNGPLSASDAPRSQVVGAVGFVGDLNGLVYLYLDLSFANFCTSQLLGMSELELDAAGDEVVNDAIGELTNMSVGRFKNGLCDAGYPCKLTIPTILRGTNLSIQPIGSVARHVYGFDCGEHRMRTEILMRSDD